MKQVAESERLLLREIEDADAKAFEAVFCDPDVMRFSLGVKAPGYCVGFVQEVREEYYAKWGFGLWAVCLAGDSRAVGYSGLTRYPHRCRAGEVELAYRLAKAAWGRGIGVEAARMARDLAFDAHGAETVIALIEPANAPSIAVAERIGMRRIGERMFDGYDHPDLVYAIGKNER